MLKEKFPSNKWQKGQPVQWPDNTPLFLSSLHHHKLYFPEVLLDQIYFYGPRTFVKLGIGNWPSLTQMSLSRTLSVAPRLQLDQELSAILFGGGIVCLGIIGVGCGGREGSAGMCLRPCNNPRYCLRHCSNPHHFPEINHSKEKLSNHLMLDAIQV